WLVGRMRTPVGHSAALELPTRTALEQREDARVLSLKLSPRFAGPYKIISIVSPTTVRLRLPSHSRVHPTFHVSQIKPVVSSSLCPPAEPPPPTQDHHGRRIHQIVASRRRGRGFQYLVDWVGCGPEERIWLAGSSIPDRSLIDSFLSSRPSTSSSWSPGGDPWGGGWCQDSASRAVQLSASPVNSAFPQVFRGCIYGLCCCWGKPLVSYTVIFQEVTKKHGFSKNSDITLYIFLLLIT
uniref:Chromo domain-containing protein n=1 Tax=Fundulus heteroclitus TaxID=8078 RepID=A0A3Q2P3M4_FUNHE